MSVDKKDLATPIHLNSDLLCAIDLEYTDLDPEIGHIFDMAIIPLTVDFEPNKNVPWFNVQMRPPKHDVNVDSVKIAGQPYYKSCLETGLDPETVKDLFEEWLRNKIALPFLKKIVPVAHAWRTDSLFLEKFFGPVTFASYFSHRVRDTMLFANFLNDNAYFGNVPIPFPCKLTLSNLAKQLSIETDRELLHTAGYDAFVTAQVYKKMLLLPKF